MVLKSVLSVTLDLLMYPFEKKFPIAVTSDFESPPGVAHIWQWNHYKIMLYWAINVKKTCCPVSDWDCPVCDKLTYSWTIC